jgi:NAD(P)-dependent dehydrogenase (short-subunit alcohol dehydrogenase family)
LAISKQLLADGVSNIALLDISDLTANAASLQSSFPSASILSIQASTAVEAEVESAVQQVKEKFGRIDIGVNAAGISGDAADTANGTVANHEKVLGVNMWGVWFCERALIRVMLAQDEREVR